MQYIRRYYGVPATRGRTVEYCGIRGRILSADGAYLRIAMDERSKIKKRCHPTWNMRYWLGDRWFDPSAQQQETKP